MEFSVHKNYVTISVVVKSYLDNCVSYILVVDYRLLYSLIRHVTRVHILCYVTGSLPHRKHYILTRQSIDSSHQVLRSDNNKKEENERESVKIQNKRIHIKHNQLLYNISSNILLICSNLRLGSHWKLAAMTWKTHVVIMLFLRIDKFTGT